MPLLDVALCVPLVGITTIVLTNGTACWLHFDCPAQFPVLSHAAEYSPEYYIFAAGMNTTAYFMYATSHWFSLHLQRHATDIAPVRWWSPVLYWTVAATTASALSVLALFDCDRFILMHTIATVLFFLLAWVLIALTHVARRAVLLTHASAFSSRQALWRLRCRKGVRQGTMLIVLGLVCSFTFAYVYLARRKLVTPLWEGEIGVAWESTSEVVGVVCQLLYIGTLSADIEAVGDCECDSCRRVYFYSRTLTHQAMMQMNHRSPPFSPIRCSDDDRVPFAADDDVVLTIESSSSSASSSSDDSSSCHNESNASNIDDDDDQHGSGSSSHEPSDDDDDDSASSQFLQYGDSLGFVPLVLGATVVVTTGGTITWSCFHPRIDCRASLPTLSAAARFRPQQYLFTCGMFLASLLWLTTLLLFHWHARLVLHDARSRVLSSATLLPGLVSAFSLLALAFLDIRSHPDGHGAATVAFFASTYMTMGFVCLLRRRCVTSSQRHTSAKVGETLAAASMSLFLACRSIVHAQCDALVDAIVYLCVAGSWWNPLGLSASTLSTCECMVLATLVLFAGTMGHELASLTHVVEDKYLLALRRTK
ncbi:Aste57867_18157 [Aphanomyces stellatus]|uniref:Aste57867_18157 protein n=1 Tax=Aphanomyces stellatus TaxID=120398 RepID=A0A485LAY3_9STRA|nr:hypothetical protein As57867_018095 [Aphanomyces stellatus]VFT94895.1 Aste57867_18157 [Aphanomyces stellatus]